MIFLLKDVVAGEKIVLSEQKEYVVGRKNCDILLEKDQSISRRHAVIRVKENHVTLEDCKSKYHTSINGVEISPDVEIKLKHLDLIQFGAFNSKFCFEEYKFIVAASALSMDKKVALKENLSKCNGKYVDKWSSSCTHLTVDKITLTIKVLQALIDEKPIVTPEYWLKYAQSIEANTVPPDINLYNKPPVAEQLLRSDFHYKLDPARKRLFNNKVFVFSKNDMKKQMEEVIKNCDGECMAWEEDPKTVDDFNSSSKEHVIIKTDGDDENVSFNAVLKHIAKQGKRAISLNEIALAIIHCSTEINCNPSFNKVNEVFGAHTQKLQTMGILAPDTETESEPMVPAISALKSEKVIPSSVEDDLGMDVSNTKECGKETAGPSRVKRPSTNQDIRGFLKKPKIEAKEEEPKTKEQEKPDEIEDESSSPQKNRTNSKTVDSSIKNKPKPAQKRKAEEDLEKSPKKTNPFSLLPLSTKKRNMVTEEDNPFEIVRSSSKQTSSSKSPMTKDENPFVSITRRNTPDVQIKEEIIKPQQEPRKEIRLIPYKTDKSDATIGSTYKRSILNITWLSKNSPMAVKKEVKEEDSELVEISKAFKDCVKVEILPMYSKKEISENVPHNTSYESVDGKKNFKKFKKVKPMKPQITIIPRNQLTRIAPGEVTGIQVNDADSDDETGPSNAPNIQQKGELSLPSHTKQRKVKKFVF